MTQFNMCEDTESIVMETVLNDVWRLAQNVYSFFNSNNLQTFETYVQQQCEHLALDKYIIVLCVFIIYVTTVFPCCKM